MGIKIHFLFYFGDAAMLNFPTRYTFNVVGKKGEGNDDDNGDTYLEEVKKVILNTAGGDGDDENGITISMTPRGTKFMKLQVEVEVQSSTMITTIYEDIGALPGTVMKF